MSKVSHEASLLAFHRMMVISGRDEQTVEYSLEALIAVVNPA